MRSFSDSESTMDSRRWPSRTRSRAVSKSAMAMSRLPRRTAWSAASLTRLARSAPLMPGVPRATTLRSTSEAIRLPLQWTCRIGRRSSRSGSGTTIWRSKRPGRSSAGSRMSGRLVAAIITTPSAVSKPSISESIWLSVCSRSSCPPPSPAPRLRPMESISSTKTMAGACLRAVWDRAPPRVAPAPPEHLNEAGAAHRHEGHAGLASHGPGDERLARAGRPHEQDPLRDLRPDLLEAGGRLEEVDHLADLLLDAGVAGDVVEGGRRAVAAEGLGLGAPDRHDPRHLPAGLAADEVDEGGADPDDEDVGQQGGEDVRGRGGEADLDAVVAHGRDVVGQGRGRALDF